MEKGDINQGLECTAPKRWSKNKEYTTGGCWREDKAVLNIAMFKKSEKKTKVKERKIDRYSHRQMAINEKCAYL